MQGRYCHCCHLHLVLPPRIQPPFSPRRLARPRPLLSPPPRPPPLPPPPPSGLGRATRAGARYCVARVTQTSPHAIRRSNGVITSTASLARTVKPPSILGVRSTAAPPSCQCRAARKNGQQRRLRYKVKQAGTAITTTVTRRGVPSIRSASIVTSATCAWCAISRCPL
jgi:hypothetical protein